jgi:hypothetical protein
MNNKQKVLAVGCSFTRGHGLDYESADPNLWVNRLFPNKKYVVNNVSVTGVNNDWIFLETVSQMLKCRYDIVLVGWSSIPRFNFNVGLELYKTMTRFTDMDINLHSQITIPGPWLESIGNNLLRIHNDHWDLLNLVKYVNVLIKLQQVNHGKIVFVNSLGPWSENYFQKKTINLPSDLDSYTYDLLSVDQRDDTNIFALYDMIHQHYQDHGGIREKYWLNLYESLMNLRIDVTDGHPGYKSQELYENKLAPVLEQSLAMQ